MQEKLTEYKNFISVLNRNINMFFDNQKDFIKCAAGCSYCCTSGYYPVTDLEFEYIKSGFNTLNKEKQDIILERCEKIELQKAEFLQEGRIEQDFSYACPMLFDNMCSIYEFRPIICRAYGLITPSKNSNKFNLPSCKNIGLNYSNVWDEELNDFSFVKAKNLNIKSNPEAFDIGYENLINKFDYIGFGKIKMLYAGFNQ